VLPPSSGQHVTLKSRSTFTYEQGSKYIPFDSELHTRRRENLKSHKLQDSTTKQVTYHLLSNLNMPVIHDSFPSLFDANLRTNVCIVHVFRI
jgi:hypothetical protein